MKKILFLNILLLLHMSSHAQFVFSKTYTNANLHAQAYSGIKTLDGGYIIAGMTNDFSSIPSTSYNVQLIKIKVNGDTAWTKKYIKTSDEICYDIQQTSDSSYILTGYTQSFGAGGEDALLMKTDKNGNYLWSKAYGTSTPQEEGRSVKPTPDGGYIIAGGQDYTGTSMDNAFLIKTDSLGNQQWFKYFNGSVADAFKAVVVTADSGYLAVGWSNSFLMNTNDVLLVKVDTLGNVLWQKVISDFGNERGYSIAPTYDGGYIITGTANDAFSGNYKVYLVKVNGNGNALWSKSYAGLADCTGYSVQETFDRGFIIAGNYGNTGSSGNDFYLIRTDSIGNMVWSRNIGYPSIVDIAYEVREAPDGGFAVTGCTYAASSQAMFVKTDSDGNAGCNTGTPSTVVSIGNPITTNVILNLVPSGTMSTSTFIQKAGGKVYTQCFNVATSIPESITPDICRIYPNPFMTNTTLLFDKNYKNISISIMDMMGNKVRDQEISGKEAVIEKGNIPAGIYFIKIVYEGMNIELRKIVIQ